MRRFLSLSLVLLLALARVTAQAQTLGENAPAAPQLLYEGPVSITPVSQLQQVVAEKDFAPARVIHEDALRNINDNAAMLAKQKKTTPPEPVNPNILYGVNTLALTVLDTRTLRPVAEYTVHAEIVMAGSVLRMGGGFPVQRGGGAPNDPFAAGEPQLVDEPAAVVGRLESQRVKDAAGRCRYEGLGRLTVRFSIWAKGYLPKTETVRVPEGGPGVIVRLTPAGSIKGRVVDAKTGAPLRGVEVNVSYPFKSRPNHTQETYSDSSNDEGRFCIERLTADRYLIGMNKPPLTIDALSNLAKAEGMMQTRRGTLDEAGAQAQACREAYARALEAPAWVMPRLKPVELKDGATLDLGTIRLERAPTVELEVTYEGQVPLGNFPFDLVFPKGLTLHPEDIYSLGHFMTDDDGKARVTLAGWKPGMIGMAFAPSSEPGGNWDLEKLVARLDDPKAVTSEREWFEVIADTKTSFTLKAADLSPLVFQGWGDIDKQPEIGMQQNIPNSLKGCDYDDLTPEAKVRFRASLEQIKSEFRKQRAERGPKPDHPNYEVFTPRAGEVSRVRLDFRPTTATVDLMLRFIDKTTKQPVARFEGSVGGRMVQFAAAVNSSEFPGALAVPGNFRIFRALDGSGQAVVPALMLPPEVQEMEKELKQLRRDFPGHDRIKELEKNSTLGLIVAAPGYTLQAFGITLDQIRAGGELTFELEPAASVRGRVVLGATGEPLTSATLQAVLKRWGRWKESWAMEWPHNRHGRVFVVEFNNPVLEGRQDEAIDGAIGQPRDKVSATIGPDGRFKIDGLLPHQDWQCKIETGVLPGYRRQGLALEAGVNDLGEIRLNLSGWLAGKFVDEQGKGIEGMMLEFPAEPIGRHDRETTQTRASGDYRINLLPFKNDRQLVRVIPPWGDNDETTTSPKMKVSAAYETMLTLDRCASNTLAARLHRGSPLVLRLPPSARRAELERVYSIPANWPIMGVAAVEDDREKFKLAQPYFAVRRIALQGLEAGPEGLAYAQLCDISGPGARLTSGPLELRLERIPPGRYALSVEGGLMDAARPEDPGTEIESGIYETIPLAYAEFTMPPTSATLELAPAAAELELALDGVPPGVLPSQKTMGPFVFIEREGAQSTLHATALRRLFAQARRELRNRWSNEEIDVGAMPLLGYFVHFIKPDAAGRQPDGWQPARLRAVPPGAYRIQAYAHPDALLDKNGGPYYEDRVEVTSQTRRLRLAIPWQSPPERKR